MFSPKPHPPSQTNRREGKFLYNDTKNSPFFGLKMKFGPFSQKHWKWIFFKFSIFRYENYCLRPRESSVKTWKTFVTSQLLKYRKATKTLFLFSWLQSENVLGSLLYNIIYVSSVRKPQKINFPISRLFLFLL